MFSKDYTILEPGWNFTTFLNAAFFVAMLTVSPNLARSESDLHTGTIDGLSLAVGPVLAASFTDGEPDSFFGGELALSFVDQQRAISGVGAFVDLLAYGDRQGGRTNAGLFLAHQPSFGGLLGISIAYSAEIDRIDPPRHGASVSLWYYAGIRPYVRAGSVQREGIFFDIGLSIPLPLLQI